MFIEKPQIRSSESRVLGCGCVSNATVFIIHTVVVVVVVGGKENKRKTQA